MTNKPTKVNSSSISGTGQERGNDKARQQTRQGKRTAVPEQRQGIAEGQRMAVRFCRCLLWVSVDSSSISGQDKDENSDDGGIGRLGDRTEAG
jgi:hypothetical protein